MAFFDVPTDDEIPAESARWLEEYRKLVGRSEAPSGHRAYGRLAPIVEARLRVCINLFDRCSFPKDVKYVAGMLIAHARRCQACFGASRLQLGTLGFDEEALDGMCAHPDTLPLNDKNRAFVQFALKVATTPAADLTPKDFQEAAAAGLSREEVQETIAFAAFWVMNTIFNSAALVALSEG
jgi:alkylhydroperoxidase family enzyme